jgi:hypothetical protein
MSLTTLLSLLFFPYTHSTIGTTTWHVNIGLFSFNPYSQAFGLLILGIGLWRHRTGKPSGLIFLAFYTALVGIVFHTFHGGILQLFLPIPLPENPFDPNLIANYLVTVIIVFALFPFVFMYLFREIDTYKLGLCIPYPRETIKWTFIAGMFTLAIYPLPDLLLGRTGGPPFTPYGLFLWFFVVGWAATWLQMFFYQGILFTRYVEEDGWPLLFFVSIVVFQLFIPLGPPSLDIIAVIGWILHRIRFIVLWGIRLWLILRTRTIYGALVLSSLSVIGNTVLWII